MTTQQESSDYVYVIQELQQQITDLSAKLADKGAGLRKANVHLQNTQQTVEQLIAQSQGFESKLKAAHTAILALGGEIPAEASVELAPLDSAPPSTNIPVGEPLTPH